MRCDRFAPGGFVRAGDPVEIVGNGFTVVDPFAQHRTPVDHIDRQAVEFVFEGFNARLDEIQAARDTAEAEKAEKEAERKAAAEEAKADAEAPAAEEAPAEEAPAAEAAAEEEKSE